MAENTHQHHLDPLLLQSLKCPRCDSSNTKFCYYNNYSLSQPRHFCKACKRYWTRGGTLRNVPVGGGCRKNKRVRRQTTSAAAAAVETPPTAQSCNLSSNPIRVKFPISTNNYNNNSRGSEMNGFGIGGSDEFLHDMANSAPVFHSLGNNNNHSSLCFGSSSFSNSTATMAMATLQQQKLFDSQMGDEIRSLQYVNHPSDSPLIWFDTTSMMGSSVPSLI